MTEPKHVRIVDGIPCITLTEHEHLVNKQLAESQSREVKLRKALEKIANNTIHWYSSIQDAKEALAIQADDTALQEASRQAKREVLMEALTCTTEEIRRMAEELK